MSLARPNRVEVDPAAIAANLAALRATLRPGTRVFAALKADAEIDRRLSRQQ